MSDNIYPLPADEIGALYEVKTHELILSAKGTSQPMTSDINFKRMLLPCGLKFELEGRVLAIMGKPRPYSVTKRFKMPPPTNPYVIVVYAGDLKGKPIPIHFTGYIPPSSGEGSDSSTKQEPPELPQTQALENEEINVINGRTFTIQVASEVPRLGSINMDHDPKYLELLTAGIRDKNIYWEFKALQPTRDTQIRLFFAGGTAQYVYQKVYDVLIGLAHGPVVELTQDGLIPPPAVRVEQGIKKIKETYPDAKLHDVDYRSPSNKPVENPYELSSLTVYCEVDGGKQLASVSTIGYGPYGPIELREKVLDDRQSFEYPVKIDIPEADEAMKKAGFKEPYTSATLDSSILPSGDKEPNYTFSMVQIPGGPREVRVGATDGRVTPFGQVLPPKGA
ncbi:hypothetical protein JMJ35_005379 [Cladonia borealis]|uniref:Uncharacterized protein n=1 Tax=Cladonia borealis TaxID=184061 RepID=A0AA39R1B9_9LECA|nr:hypothetical protein JMJ35_005379 [Cladonia borealis]